MAGTHTAARQRLRTTLADCTHFRNWRGHGWTQQQALDRIYYGGLPRPPANQKAYTLEQLRLLRPYVSLHTEPEGGAVWHEGAVEDWEGSGILWACFFRDVDAAQLEDDDIGVIEEAFVDEIDNMVWSTESSDNTLTSLSRSGTAGYLYIGGPIRGYGPWRSESDAWTSYGDVLKYELAIPWGVQA